MSAYDDHNDHNTPCDEERDEERDEKRDEDGRLQPLPVTAARVGDWACGLLHVWPASAFPTATNTTAAAPKCPICDYPLWRVKAIGDGVEDGADGTPLRVRVQFEERER